MSRRRNSSRKADTKSRKATTRFTRRRRKRRRAPGASNTIDHANQKHTDLPVVYDQVAEGEGWSSSSPSAPWSRAPRKAEPPPKDPNVFSYTYTIWKTS